MKYTLSLILLLFFTSTAAAVELFVEDLGTDFVPAAANAAGDLAGHRLSTDQAALRSNAGTITDIGTLGGSTSRSTAFSPDGVEVLGGADINSGVRNSFRYSVGGGISSVLGASQIENEAVGMDGAGNIIINLDSAPDRILRWNQSDSSVDTAETDAVATGVTTASVIAGFSSPFVQGIYHDGSTNSILPFNYNPTAGINNNDLTAGQLVNTTAAMFRVGDPMAVIVPNIFTLGPVSEATGVSETDILYGNVGSTVFSYDVVNDVLTDLNTLNIVGASVASLDTIIGVSPNNVFFGSYTAPGTTTTHFYKASIVVPEPSCIVLLLAGIGFASLRNRSFTTKSTIPQSRLQLPKN